MKKIIKTFTVNLGVFLVLVGAIYVLTVLEAFRWNGPKEASEDELARYQNAPWASQVIFEDRSQEFDFHSYFAWRSRPYSGELINVKSPWGERLSAQTRNPQATAAFFGGSTIWGTGAPDAFTIPSEIAKHSGYIARNFGERGYTAHQSVEFLTYLERRGVQPDLVVFYDGVNDIMVGCDAKWGPYSHGMSLRIQESLKVTENQSLLMVLAPVLKLAKRLKNRMISGNSSAPSPRDFRCDEDAQLAQAVADNLVADWKLARDITESNGGRFAAFLQPVGHLTTSPVSHLSLNPDEARQFAAVYPLIQAQLKPNGFHDLSTVLDQNEPVYVDHCHLMPRGNAIVAKTMLNYLPRAGDATP